MKTAIIIANNQKPKSVEFADVAMSFLDKAGYGVQMYEEGAFVCKTASFALVLGGDGTILRASKRLYGLDIPLFGINFGHLGYLSGISSEAPIDGLKRLVSGEYEIERRLMLNAQVIRGDKVIVDSICLNEASIHRSTLLHALSLDVMMNTKHTETIVGDGVIVATPTGSTSYNLSAGGPVLTPTSSSIVITPVCAKYFPQSSIVTDGADETEICVSYETINEQGAPCLVLDGDERVTLENGDLVKIKRAEHDAKIIKITDKSFYQILKEKLSK
jgi:NAD+ kinase